MNPKVVALAVVLVIIVSGTFYYLRVDYPFGISQPPVDIKNVSLFQNEILPTDKLGYGVANATNLQIGSKVTTVVQGYVHNRSSTLPIANSELFVAAYPAETSSPTTQSGFYTFEVLYAVSGTFSFKVPGYRTMSLQESWSGGTSWLNLSFSPAQKHLIQGTTVYQNGSILPNAEIQFIGAYGQDATVSGPSGRFSIELYNDSYLMTTNMYGFQPGLTPYVLNVTGPGTYTLVYHQSGALFNVSGRLLYVNGAGIAGGNVSYQLVKVITGPNGYYSIKVPYGADILQGSAADYASNSTNVFVNSNLTGINIVLNVRDPFVGPPGSTGSWSPLVGGNVSGMKQSTVVPTSYSQYGMAGTLINNSTHLPIQNLTFTIIIEVNSVYFYKVSQTNLSGEFGLDVRYKGTYDFYFNSVTYLRNQTLVPVAANGSLFSVNLIPSGKISLIYVNGTVTNRATALPLDKAAVTFANPANASYNYSTLTNATGKYTLHISVGVYNASASLLGFLPNYTVRTFNSNSILNFALTPIYPLGIGGNNTNWNPSNGTGIPGVTNKSVTSNLTRDGNITGKQNESIFLKLVNASSVPLPYLQFAFFTEVNGVYARVVNETNATAYSVIKTPYNGTYPFVIEALQFVSKEYNASYGQYSLTVVMKQRPLVWASDTFQNNFNKTVNLSATNLSVPLNSLILSNSIVQPYNGTGYGYETKSLTGTDYRYLLGNASSYVFNYTNLHFAPYQWVFSMTVPTAVSMVSELQPYEIIINSSTGLKSTVTISGTSVNNQLIPTGTNTRYSPMLSQSTWNVHFNLPGGTLLNSTAVALAAAKPNKTLNFNLTTGSVTFTKISASSLSNGTDDVNYTGTISGEFYAYFVNISLVFSGNTGIYFDLNPVPTPAVINTGPSYTLFNLTNPLLISSSTQVTINAGAVSGSVLTSTANIYYYSSVLT